VRHVHGEPTLGKGIPDGGDKSREQRFRQAAGHFGDRIVPKRRSMADRPRQFQSRRKQACRHSEPDAGPHSGASSRLLNRMPTALSSASTAWVVKSANATQLAIGGRTERYPDQP
jgi:hypothetical protein